jgi:hypothetical protein
VHREYAKNPEHYIRAFQLIQNDLLKLFEYIEPDDCNLQTYSYRTHELLIRTCIEIEANFKAILKENVYSPVDKRGKPRPENQWNIDDYKKVNVTHHLAGYKIYVPIWNGAESVYEPYREWSMAGKLPWYQAYNKSKHDRQMAFKEASFGNLVNAVAGLVAILSSQFGSEEFSPGPSLMEVRTDSYYSTSPALGGFFHIEFPNDWTDEEKYDFDWMTLKTQPDRFNKIDYDRI